jgi:sulfite reductase alpha subunit-like flavoprotein
MGGYLYVCGSVRMAKDVHAAMVALLVQHDGMTEAEAEAELVAMAARGRYVRDVWY